MATGRENDEFRIEKEKFRGWGAPWIIILFVNLRQAASSHTAV
jgi:hypothetical protein